MKKRSKTSMRVVVKVKKKKRERISSFAQVLFIATLY
jgi:hypothetical protein